jgi:hypothetical protein
VVELLHGSRQVLRVSDRLKVLAKQFVFGVPNEVAKRGVYSKEAALQRNDNHADACISENAAQNFFRWQKSQWLKFVLVVLAQHNLSKSRLAENVWESRHC